MDYINDSDIEMREAAETADRISAANRQDGLVDYDPEQHQPLLKDLAGLAVDSWGSATADLVELMAEQGVRVDLFTNSNDVFDALQEAR